MLSAGWLLEMSPSEKNVKFEVIISIWSICIYVCDWLPLQPQRQPAPSSLKGKISYCPPPQFPKRSYFAWLRKDSHFSRVLTQSILSDKGYLVRLTFGTPRGLESPFSYFSLPTLAGVGWLELSGCYCAKAFSLGGHWQQKVSLLDGLFSCAEGTVSQSFLMWTCLQGRL